MSVGASSGSDLVKDPLTERAGDVFLNPDGFITYQRAYFLFSALQIALTLSVQQCFSPTSPRQNLKSMALGSSRHIFDSPAEGSRLKFLSGNVKFAKVTKVDER